MEEETLRLENGASLLDVDNQNKKEISLDGSIHSFESLHRLLEANLNPELFQEACRMPLRLNCEHSLQTIALSEDATSLSTKYDFDLQMAQESEEDSSSVLAFMKLALDQAKFALDNLEVPVGCVIIQDDKVIACGSNRTSATRNATRHAEMEAIDSLLGKWRELGLDQTQVAEHLSRLDLYVTCEPCIMCATALSILGIRKVFYGCANDKFGGCGSILSLHESSSKFSRGALHAKDFKCTGGIMAEEAVALFRCFYEQGNPNAPKPHRSVRVPQRE